MVCCLNPYCDGNNRNPVNPDGAKRCQYCKEPLIPLLRGRYKVLQVLGQGGFGRTYLAEDHDKLEQSCVVKQLLPQGGSKAVELFQREAHQLQRLGKDNPQIPSLEAYFSENNALFLVQQFIEGETLAQELERRGRWTEAEVRALLLDWLPLLVAVHAQGVIHRDLKPDNLMRRRDNGRVIMIDFGLSKEFKGSVVAMPGTAAGTRGYSPVEQLQYGEAYPSSDYACRACSTTPFHFGETIRPDLVNYNGDHPYRNASKGEYRQQTVPVGSLPPNLWGLHEMHGNLWEWCEDGYTNDYAWKNENHLARNNSLNILPYSDKSRVLRGGSWNNIARYCRSANRVGEHRGYSNVIRGFRVLLSSRTS